jgi:hypothetical protein
VAKPGWVVMKRRALSQCVDFHFIPLLISTDEEEGTTTLGANRPCFPGDVGIFFYYHPYLSCWLHLHRELRGGKESRGWMQSLGVHGTQGGLQRTKLT